MYLQKRLIRLLLWGVFALPKLLNQSPWPGVPVPGVPHCLLLAPQDPPQPVLRQLILGMRYRNLLLLTKKWEI